MACSAALSGVADGDGECNPVICQESNKVCVQDACKLKNGEQCTAADECASGFCNLATYKCQ